MEYADKEQRPYGGTVANMSRNGGLGLGQGRAALLSTPAGAYDTVADHRYSRTPLDQETVREAYQLDAGAQKLGCLRTADVADNW